MSYTTLKSKKVKIKKPHRCFACSTVMEPPAQMTYNVGVNDGSLQTTYMCNICYDFMTADKWRDWDYEMGCGEIWEDRDYKEFRNNHLTNQQK